MSPRPELPERRERLERLLTQACAPHVMSEEEVLTAALAREHLTTDRLMAYAREQLAGQFGSLLGERESRAVESHLLECRSCLEEFAAIELRLVGETRKAES